MAREVGSSDFRGAALAVSALLLTQKRTPKAAKRCAKRVDRALERLAEIKPEPETQADVGSEAQAWLALRCRVCGVCKGRGTV